MASANAGFDKLMTRRYRSPQLPLRRRLGTNPAVRTIRVGPAIWRVRLTRPEEWPEAAVSGYEYVRLENPSGSNHWVVMVAGEFQRVSNYRLRSIILGLEEDDDSAGAA